MRSRATSLSFGGRVDALRSATFRNQSFPSTAFGAFGGNAVAALVTARIQVDGQDIPTAVAKAVPAASDHARLDALALPDKSLTRQRRWRSTRACRVHRQVMFIAK
jgi:hypothetical protein